MLPRKPFTESDRNERLVDIERIVGKSLPYSAEAEKALLGAILLDQSHLQRILDELKPSDFYVPSYRLIYQNIIYLRDKYTQIDIITLQDELSKRGNLDAMGGIDSLMALQDDFSVIGFVEQHITLVKEKSILRDLASSAARIISQCYAQDDQGINVVIDQAENILFDMSARRTKQSFVQLDIWLKSTFKSLSEIKSSAKGVTGVPSGFNKLDEMTSGFQAGDFIVIAARPSMGKSALAMCIARHAAAQGSPVGVISLEMSAEQLALRLLSCESRVKLSSVRTGVMTPDEWLRLTHSAAHLAEFKLYIDDTSLQTIMDVRTKARKLKIEFDVKLLIIDYLQLLNSVRRHENRHQEVSEISRFLKALAKELKIPIIALSQLSRTVDSRTDKRPMLSDLRDSGAIEQDADLIMFLYRDIVYNQDTPDPSVSELIVGKQRNGPTGTILLRYNNNYTSFENLS